MKNISLLIFGITFVALLSFLGGYYFAKQIQKAIENSSSEITFNEQIKNDIKTIYPDYIDSDLQSFASQLKQDYPENDTQLTDPSAINSYLLWNNGEHYITIPDSTKLVEINFRNPKDVRVFVTNNEDEEFLSAYNQEILNNLKIRFFKLITTVDNTMLSNGYTKSDFNIIREPWFDSLEVGYEKGNTKCVLGSKAGEISFDCVESSESDIALQSKMLLDLELSSNSYISVNKLTDNFASLNVSEFGTIGGYLSIIEKRNDKWMNIFSGQENPTCKLMLKNEVPKSIYGECIK